MTRRSLFWVWGRRGSKFFTTRRVCLCGVFMCLCVCMGLCLAYSLDWSEAALGRTSWLGAHSNIKDTHSVRPMVCIWVVFGIECLRGVASCLTDTCQISLSQKRLALVWLNACSGQLCFNLTAFTSCSSCCVDPLYYLFVWVSVKLRKAGFGVKIKLPCWVHGAQLLPTERDQNKTGGIQSFQQ